MPAEISIENLNFSYTPDNPVLKNISLEIAPGEKFGIIGPSGAGKSTLLLHLNGILTGTGVVRIGKQIVEKGTLASVRRVVGLVFQNPDDQLFSPNVEDDIAFGPLNFGFSREEVSARVRESLVSMKLEGHEKSVSHHMSLGERKRIALATVLAIKPEVIAFDEPFSSLDPSMVMQLVDIIKGLDSTIVIVSQSVLPLVSCCSRLAIIRDGEVLAVGNSRDIIRNDELMKAGGMDLSLYHKVYREYFS